MAGERHIVGLGGGGDTPEQTRRLYTFILGLARTERPRILYVPTAAADSPESVVWFYEQLAGMGELRHARFFPWPRDDLRAFTLEHDVVVVSGGNTVNMLAIWRAHGFDSILREAWDAGTVLCGASAGMICWFEAGVSDSFGPQLEGIECLGWLPGSACPHYDGEERRRPRYRELVDDGFPDGLAADDGVGLHFVGTELREVVSCRRGAGAYRVTRAGEERLEPRPL